MKRNINDFSYNSKPTSQVRKFGIITLSDNGLNEYVNKDSYTHLYLFEKHLGQINESYEKGNNNRVLIDPNSTFEFENKVEKKNFIQGQDTENHNLPIITKELVDTKNDANWYNTEANVAALTQNKSTINRKFLTENGKKIHRKSNTVLRNSNDYYFSNFENLKTSYCNTDILYANLNKKPALYNFMGFKSTEVPRVDSIARTKQQEHTNQFQFINKKLNKCIGNTGSLENENEHIKSILTEKVQLPELNQLKKIAKEKKIKDSKVGISFSKYMGERYSPHNFDYNFLKTATRRNVYGALFQH